MTFDQVSFILNQLGLIILRQKKIINKKRYDYYCINKNNGSSMFFKNLNEVIDYFSAKGYFTKNYFTEAQKKILKILLQNNKSFIRYNKVKDYILLIDNADKIANNKKLRYKDTLKKLKSKDILYLNYDNEVFEDYCVRREMRPFLREITKNA